MKESLCIIFMCSIFVISAVSPASSQSEITDSYTIVNSTGGPMVCLGRWVPSTDVSKPGTCEGQIIDIAQLTALSSRESVIKLDQMLQVLTSIDKRLDLNNSQVAILVQAAVESRSSSEQGRQTRDLLIAAINGRFEAMPKEITSADSLRKELAKLRQDILRDVEQLYPAQPAQAGPEK